MVSGQCTTMEQSDGIRSNPSAYSFRQKLKTFFFENNYQPYILLDNLLSRGFSLLKKFPYLQFLFYRLIFYYIFDIYFIYILILDS